MTYYNTNKESGTVLGKSEEKAGTQEEIIYRHFLRYPKMVFGASQLRAILPASPITSIRRALTNLTAAGKLTKTETMTLGDYGKKEHCWTLTKKSELLF